MLENVLAIGYFVFVFGGLFLIDKYFEMGWFL